MLNNRNRKAARVFYGIQDFSRHIKNVETFGNKF